MADDADVVIVGGGIAGTTAAYYAARAGRSVTLIDEGLDAASTLPVALVNPLRGHAGRLVARGIDGMRKTFELVDALVADGHRVVHRRGLHRPLIARDAAASQEAFWRTRLVDSVNGRALAFDWHAEAPTSLGLVDRVPSLFLRDAGWIAAASLLTALVDATPTIRIAARVATVERRVATLADGTTIGARAILWCGGARGAARLDGEAHDGIYKPGSLVVVRREMTLEPVSFGLYAVPIDGTTIVGPTREDSTSTFSDAPVADSAVRHLEDRIAATFGTMIGLEPLWRGTRLARLSKNAAAALRGVDTLTALGSRGFLMAPLFADEWARSL